MPFTTHEKQLMLALKGVGATVIQRLEEIGFHSLAELQHQDAAIITKQISTAMKSTCWHNSPKARAAIHAIIALANRAAPSS
jgi:hypothetical protein